MLDRVVPSNRLSIVDLLKSTRPLPSLANRPRLTFAWQIWYSPARLKHIRADRRGRCRRGARRGFRFSSDAGARRARRETREAEASSCGDRYAAASRIVVAAR